MQKAIQLLKLNLPPIVIYHQLAFASLINTSYSLYPVVFTRKIKNGQKCYHCTMYFRVINSKKTYAKLISLLVWDLID